MIANEVQKSGEIFLQTILERSKGGIKLTVKGHPLLEKFTSSLVEGAPKISISRLGLDWLSKDTLKVYDIPAGELQGVKYGIGPSRIAYRVDRVGKPLIGMDDSPLSVGGQRVINISFLRLVGISEGNGITFEIRGVLTKDGTRELSDSIGQAARSFYEQYLRDLKMVSTLSIMQADSSMPF